MQKLAPLMVGILMAWLVTAHAGSEADYIIQSNAAPLIPLTAGLTAGSSPAAVSQPAPADAADAAALAVGPPPAVKKIRIGLILPTESASFGEAANVVRAGFTAAAKVDGTADVVDINEQQSDLVARFRTAEAEGVQVMVGPLTRQGIALVAPFVTVPTLVLNTLDPGMPTNPKLLSLSLAVEGEGREMARVMRQEGRQNPVVVSDGGILSQRLSEAFVSAWRKQTGRPPRVVSWPLAGTIDETIGQADSLFVALDATEATALKAALPATLAVYATSLLNTRHPDPGLTGVRVIDMPWFLMPEVSWVSNYPRPASPLTMQTERLYALGIDAYRLAVKMADGAWKPGSLTLQGVTGALTLQDDRQFSRQLPVAVITAPPP